MKKFKGFFLILPALILFSCANKGKVYSVNNTYMQKRPQNSLVVRGVDYHTEMRSRYLKYSGSKQMFLEPDAGHTILKETSQELQFENKEEVLEYVSKIPDLSESERKINPLIVYFDFNSAVIKKSEMGKLKDLVRYASTRKVKKIILNGYTDEIGSEEYNYKLAYERANSVKKVLKEKIKSKNIEYVINSKGKCCFVSDKDHAKNRRVEIEIQVY